MQVPWPWQLPFTLKPVASCWHPGDRRDDRPARAPKEADVPWCRTIGLLHLTTPQLPTMRHRSLPLCRSPRACRHQRRARDARPLRDVRSLSSKSHMVQSLSSRSDGFKKAKHRSLTSTQAPSSTSSEGSRRPHRCCGRGCPAGRRRACAEGAAGQPTGGAARCGLAWRSQAYIRKQIADGRPMEEWTA